MKVAITNSLLKHQCIRGWSITNRKKQQKEQKEKEKERKKKRAKPQYEKKKRTIGKTFSHSYKI